MTRSSLENTLIVKQTELANETKKVVERKVKIHLASILRSML